MHTYLVAPPATHVLGWHQEDTLALALCGVCSPSSSGEWLSTRPPLPQSKMAASSGFILVLPGMLTVSPPTLLYCVLCGVATACANDPQ